MKVKCAGCNDLLEWLCLSALYADLNDDLGRRLVLLCPKCVQQLLDGVFPLCVRCKKTVARRGAKKCASCLQACRGYQRKYRKNRDTGYGMSRALSA